MLTVPISVIVGLPLLFLAATTILPALQGISFFIGLHPQKSLPTPCPFKSPQSLAFRGLFRIVLRAATFSFFPQKLKNLAFFFTPNHLEPSIRKMWYHQTWPTIDREWLSLRDACHQRIFDHDPDLYIHQYYWKDAFPLSDITQLLVEAIGQSPGSKHTETFLTALVHCFQEISESIWTAPQMFDFQRRDRRNHYFERLHWKSPCSLSKFLLHGGSYNFNRFSTSETELGVLDYMELKIKQRQFSDDQTVDFLRKLLKNHTSPALTQYLLELWARVLHSSGHIAPLTPTITKGSSIPVPGIIDVSTIRLIVPNLSDLDQRFSAVANILDALFKSAASHRISEDQSMGALCAHPQMVEALDDIAYWTNDSLVWALKDTSQHDGIPDTENQFVRVFEFISNRLNEQRSRSSQSQGNLLDVFFYLSAIFLWRLFSHWQTAWHVFENRDSNFKKALSSLLDDLHKTWTSGRKNKQIEEQFRHRGVFEQQFSDEWWGELFTYRNSHRAVTQEDSVAEGSLSNNFPDALSQLGIELNTVTGPSRSPPSNLSLVLSYPATTIERPNIVNDSPLSPSRPSSDDDLHLTIDVETPTILKRVKAKI